MESQTIYLPSYSIGGQDVYKKIPEICSAYGKKAVVIGGAHAIAAAKNDLIHGTSGTRIEIISFIVYRAKGTQENVEQLLWNPVVRAADMIFAVGGGRSIDTGKMLSDQIKKPLFVFPTIASNCAAATQLCVTYKADQSRDANYYMKTAAKHIFINLDIIAQAPLKYLLAGIGDAFGRAYEPAFTTLNEELDHSNTSAVDLAKHCGEPLIKYAIDAVEDGRAHLVSEALKQVVLNIIITDGIISNLIETDKYTGAVPHAIYRAIDAIPHCAQDFPRGEIMAYACLPQLRLENRRDDFDRQFAINHTIGLPTSLSELGIHFDSVEYEDFLDRIMASHHMDYLPYSINREELDLVIRKTEEYHQEQEAGK